MNGLPSPSVSVKSPPMSSLRISVPGACGAGAVAAGEDAAGAEAGCSAGAAVEEAAEAGAGFCSGVLASGLQAASVARANAPKMAVRIAVGIIKILQCGYGV